MVETSESFSDSNAVVSPRRVARSFGVSESSVKRWCDQGLLEFVKTPGGHRRLSVRSVLRFARENQQPLQDEAALVESTLGSPLPLRPARSELRKRLLADDLPAVRSLLESQWRSGRSIAWLSDELITPTFAAIGEQWARGSAEIYQERRACELVLRCCHDLAAHFPLPGPRALSAIGGTLPGDPFVLPSALAELVLREAGLDARSLGIGLPAATIAKAIVKRKPDLVWLAVGACNEEAAFIREFAVIESAARGVGAALVIGGRCLVPELRRKLRYSAFGDGLGQLESFARALGAGHARAL